MSSGSQHPTTNEAGIPVASDEHSLSVGADGPIVMHDHYLMEQMAAFNREMIPDRQPHAKGSGAFGHFEITQDVSQYTKAKFLQPGAKTDVLIRFSTVAGESGSPDTWRDPRGFSIKFYTEEGNFDMVGNNTPVFFVRDPMKFQHFIHSQKRRADNGLRDHDMQWDFWTLVPESAHQVAWLMGDRGVPATWRHMNGYSSHTYMWVNDEGERFWVKYHFKTDQGIKCMTQEQADQMAGSDADYHRRDLFEAIKAGSASIKTDHIERFTETGIRLKSGEELEADIIIPATGLDIQMLGGIKPRVDGREVVLKDKVIYKNVMLEGMPNAGMIFGYTNISWTLKADIASEYLCRLINHMDRNGHQVAVARDTENSKGDDTILGSLDAGYIKRAEDRLPRQGTHGPWKASQNYLQDVKILRFDPIEDGYLEFDGQPSRASEGRSSGFLRPLRSALFGA